MVIKKFEKPKKSNDTLITDHGIIEDNNGRAAKLFIAFCYVLSALLALLGLVTIINP